MQRRLDYNLNAILIQTLDYKLLRDTPYCITLSAHLRCVSHVRVYAYLHSLNIYLAWLGLGSLAGWLVDWLERETIFTMSKIAPEG
jgi:hypothetical protein